MKTLLHFKSFLDELSKDNSRLYKMEVLKQYKDDEVIKYYLNYVYNPYIVTGISTKKLNKEVEPSLNLFSTVEELLSFIKDNPTGKDSTISLINAFKETISDELIPLLDCIILKNLQLGIEVLSINKCIPNLIPTFDIMLANKYFDKPEIVEGKEFALTTKIDGGRIIAIKNNGQVSFFTRAGQKYEGLVDLEQELLNCSEDNIVFDGEITLLNKGNLTSKEQYKETMKITRKDGEKHGVKMLVFDYMPVSYFLNQNCPLSYKARRGVLEVIFKSNMLKYFNLLPVLYQGTDTNEITKWLNYNISKGEEGVMINIIDAPYDFKRTNNLLKVKKMNDIDLPILGFEEGENRNKGKLGAIITEYKGNKVKVGGGFSDFDRDYIFHHQDEFLYKTMSVQYFEETEDKEGNPSLRFPVYLGTREDVII